MRCHEADNLNECRGKCTGDASCANGLVCYNGEEGETIPGCEKVPRHMSTFA